MQGKLRHFLQNVAEVLLLAVSLRAVGPNTTLSAIFSEKCYMLLNYLPFKKPFNFCKQWIFCRVGDSTTTLLEDVLFPLKVPLGMNLVFLCWFTKMSLYGWFMHICLFFLVLFILYNYYVSSINKFFTY